MKRSSSDFGSDDDIEVITKKATSSLAHAIPEKMKIAIGSGGRLVGIGGKNIKQIMSSSGANLLLEDPMPGESFQILSISGTREQINRAKELVEQLLNQNDGYEFTAHSSNFLPFSASSSQRNGEHSGRAVLELAVPGSKVVNVLGMGGENIKMLRTKYGVFLTFLGDNNANYVFRTLRIEGNEEAIRKAKVGLEELVCVALKTPEEQSSNNAPEPLVAQSFAHPERRGSFHTSANTSFNRSASRDRAPLIEKEYTSRASLNRSTSRNRAPLIQTENTSGASLNDGQSSSRSRKAPLLTTPEDITERIDNGMEIMSQAKNEVIDLRRELKAEQKKSRKTQKELLQLQEKAQAASRREREQAMEIDTLREERRLSRNCLHCNALPRSVVVFPCLHLAFCQGCKDQSQCPSCNVPINGKITIQL